MYNKKATGKGGFQSLQSCGLVKSSFFGTEIEVLVFSLDLDI